MSHRTIQRGFDWGQMAKPQKLQKFKNLKIQLIHFHMFLYHFRRLKFVKKIGHLSHFHMSTVQIQSNPGPIKFFPKAEKYEKCSVLLWFYISNPSEVTN